MVNWWFGARWFGILGTPPLSNKPFHKGILGIQTTGPQTHQLTIGWSKGWQTKTCLNADTEEVMERFLTHFWWLLKLGIYPQYQHYPLECGCKHVVCMCAFPRKSGKVKMTKRPQNLWRSEQSCVLTCCTPDTFSCWQSVGTLKRFWQNQTSFFFSSPYHCWNPSSWHTVVYEAGIETGRVFSSAITPLFWGGSMGPCKYELIQIW